MKSRRLNSSETFYWHDYETSGANPALDRPWQFAGIRTNSELDIIGEPLTLYARPAVDRLPHPGAVRITGITPQEAQDKGKNEADFIGSIMGELLKPKTCGVGYNSIQFDDEVTRFTAWRNFHDPYSREWRNDNSRWDLLDVARTFYVVSPEEIEWPIGQNGYVSFRLQDLTSANGIEHRGAHDALSDVIATIELAKRLRGANVSLFETLYFQRSKQALCDLIDINGLTPLVHVSGALGSARHNFTLVAPLAWHPKNNSEVIVMDLSESPDFFFADLENIKQKYFLRSRDPMDGRRRSPIYSVRLNRAPALLSTKWLTPLIAERFALVGEQYRAHLSLLRDMRGRDPHAFISKVQAMYPDRDFPQKDDPDIQLYDGFISHSDRVLCDSVRAATPDRLRNESWSFEDRRLPELLFRFRARNYPESLSPAERALWIESCKKQLIQGDFTLDLFRSELAEELSRPDIDLKSKLALDDLEKWVGSLFAHF